MRQCAKGFNYETKIVSLSVLHVSEFESQDEKIIFQRIKKEV